MSWNVIECPGMLQNVSECPVIFLLISLPKFRNAVTYLMPKLNLQLVINIHIVMIPPVTQTVIQ